MGQNGQQPAAGKRWAGQLDVAIQALAEELDALPASYPKPIIFTEFVAETLPGSHGTPPEMWSAGYQAETIRRYLDAAAQRSYMAGTRCGALPISKRPHKRHEQ